MDAQATRTPGSADEFIFQMSTISRVTAKFTSRKGYVSFMAELVSLTKDQVESLPDKTLSALHRCIPLAWAKFLSSADLTEPDHQSLVNLSFKPQVLYFLDGRTLSGIDPVIFYMLSRIMTLEELSALPLKVLRRLSTEDKLRCCLYLDSRGGWAGGDKVAFIYELLRSLGEDGLSNAIDVLSPHMDCIGQDVFYHGKNTTLAYVVLKAVIRTAIKRASDLASRDSLMLCCFSALAGLHMPFPPGLNPGPCVEDLRENFPAVAPCQGEVVDIILRAAVMGTVHMSLGMGWSNQDDHCIFAAGILLEVFNLFCGIQEEDGISLAALYFEAEQKLVFFRQMHLIEDQDNDCNVMI